ncbi:bacterio-opsin activator domain-containing protein [Natronorubrum sulfidifaciens]|uniref:Putative PAS/PAC sensor protein n=1 Tax=Natronorubrum sulfidifaciens JCM 14089 TaxID=1230460 RepID=L9WJ45_9EURY|nr:bacterio-opsin activator domain-containing protein [Natronorubrum sulfidifaciens]ELY49407.1 putative PAS/PAC sensor protein [Natronorubrum sulfidifaciens JCM 14089]
MSDESTAAVGDVVRVLVVGDSRPVDAAMDALSSQLSSISLVRERTLSSAVERLTQLEIHCVVCPFELSTLTALRERADAVPIVAVVDSETVDEETIEQALEAGATDLVESDAPRSLVATRVSNVAARSRLEGTSDQRSRSILERSDALVLVLDEAGSIAYASAAVEPRLGYTPAELERTALPQLVHPDDREPIEKTLETVSAAAFGATERVAVRLGHADGTWHAYELTVTNRIADPLVDGLVATLSATSVAESADDARTAFERLEEPVFTLGPQWELRYANAAAHQLFDPDSAPEPGTVVWDLLDDAIREQFYERVLEATTTNATVEFETIVPTLETRFVVSIYPGDDGVTVAAHETPDAEPVGVDRERFDLLESVVDTLDDGLLVLEGATIRFANATLFELVAGDTLVGRELDAVFDDDLVAAVLERAQSPVVRWMDPVSGALVAGDARRPVDVFVAPLPGDDRTLCVVRDRRRSPAASLSTIQRMIREMGDAESHTAVRQSAVDAMVECSEADLAGWYLVEEAVFRPAAVATRNESNAVDLPPIERSGLELFERLEAETAGAGECVIFDRPDIEPALSRAGLRAERVLVVSVADHGVLLATSPDPMAFEAREQLPVEIVARAATSALDALECESTVQRQRGDLDQLETAADRCQHLHESERTLLACDSRDTLEQRLCDALVSLPFDELSGSIEQAWVGDSTTGSERITPSAWAGRNGDFVESISVPIRGVDEPPHPAAQAAETLQPASIDDLDAEGIDQAWRRRTLEAEFRSVLSVPLVVDNFCYGTLTVYADQPSLFDANVRQLCVHLAAVASATIASIERKRALLADRITELEVVIRDESAALSALAQQFQRRLDVQTVVPRSSGGSTVFCTVPDVSEDEIHAAIESVSGIESGRLVGERADESLLELVLADSSVAETLATHGGVLRSVTPVDDRTRLVIALSSTVDVRSFVRMLERTHPGAELLARRQRDRSERPVRAFDAELRSRLSERQLKTLETAYYGGFFEWPRESTGETIADSLGVSQPTFSRHLRLAQQKLFELLFDERDTGHRN